MLFSKVSLTALVCLVTLNLCAQVTLEPSIVTASKVGQKQSQVTRTVDILSDSLVRANQNLSLSQLLSQRAGIQILGNGQTPGSIQTLYTRGAGAAYTLVLLDGVPVGDPSSIDGNYDLNFIDLASVERIEILKGGQSTLYGSNAVAGVINVITKKNSEKNFEPRANASFGSFNSLDFSVGAKGSISSFYYDLGYLRSQSDGFSSAASSNDSELENDGFKRYSLNARVGLKLDRLNIGFNGRLSEYDAALDAGAFTDDRDFTSDTKNIQVGGFLEYASEKNNFRLNYQSQDVRRTYLDDSTDIPATAFNKSSFATYGTRSQFIDAYNSLKISSSINWLAGFEWIQQNMEQTYESVSAFGPFVDAPIETDDAQMINTSLYSSLQLSKEEYGLELGVRANNHSVYNWNTSFTASGFVKIGSRNRLLANVGNSFRNPSLYQLFSPYGNLDLTPEESISTEISWELMDKKGSKNLSLSIFNRTIKDGLFFASLEAAPFGQYINLNTQRAYGGELSFDKNWNKIGISGNYTLLHGYLYATGVDDVDRTFDILRIPKHALQASFSYTPVEKLSLNVQLETQSVRNDRFFNSATFMSEEVELAAFALLHFQASFEINAHLSTSFTIRNVTNTRYTEVYGFTSEPVNWRLGLFYR